MKSLLMAYLLWLVGGVLGLHKFYLGRPGLGLLYFCTGGLFLIGWIVDFFTLPRQVQIANVLQHYPSQSLSAEVRRAFEVIQRELHDLFGTDTAWRKTPLRDTWQQIVTPPRPTDNDLMLALLRAAQKHGGSLSVTEGVLETGAAFADVERVLQTMVQSGYVYMDNDPATGVVKYIFKEFF